MSIIKKIFCSFVAILILSNVCLIKDTVSAEVDEETIENFCDVNNDGVINIRDQVLLSKMFESGELQFSDIPDLNGDGNVNIRDLSYATGIASDNLLEKIGGSPIERNTSETHFLDIGSGGAKPGKIATVPIKIKCNNNLESAAFIIEWENPELVVESVDKILNTTCLTNGGDNGYLTITFCGTKAVADNTIAYIDFYIPTTAKAGTKYNLNVTLVDVFAEWDGEDYADSVSVSGGSVIVEGDDSVPFSVYEGEQMNVPAEYSIYNVVSMDNNVAKVIDNVIYGISAGAVTLELMMANNVMSTASLIVKSPKNIEIEVDEEYYLFAMPDCNTIDWRYGDDLTWELSDESVASVSADGVVRGLSEGTTTLTAINFYEKVLYTGTVTVKEKKDKMPVITTFTQSGTPLKTTASQVTQANKTLTIVEPENKDFVPGDIFVDGIVTLDDIYYVGEAVINGGTISRAADFNSDDKINLNDLVDMTYYLAEIEGRTSDITPRKTSHKFSLGTAISQSGQKVSVPINIKCNNNFESMCFKIKWDDNSLKLKNKMIGAYVGENAYMNLNISPNGCEGVAFNAGPTKDGKVQELVFEIPEYAVPFTEYEICVSELSSFAETDGKNYASDTEIVNGTIIALPNESDIIKISEGGSLVLPDKLNISEITSDNTDILKVSNNILYGISGGTANVKMYINNKRYDLKVHVQSPSKIKMQENEEKSIFVTDDTVKLAWVSGDTSVFTVENGVITSHSAGKAPVYAFNKADNKCLYAGMVTVEGFNTGLQGDANSDGILNVRDAAAIASALAKGKVDMFSPNVDFNKDGKINVRDAAAIAKFLAGAVKK